MKIIRKRNNEASAVLIGGIVIVVVVLVLSGLFYTGYLPGLDLLDNGEHGEVTKTFTYQGVHGATGYELIGPNNRKGFICSYISTAYSEDIVCQGKVQIDSGSLGHVDKYAYKVYLKKNGYSSYEKVSAPEIATSSFISNANPGEIPTSTIMSEQNIEYLPVYSFSVLGGSYSNGAVKVELWGNVAGYFGIGPHEWKMIASDAAYLYSGWGSLTLPKDTNGVPKDTFEIGEHVKIGVQTSYGAYLTDAQGSTKTWSVVLHKPAMYGGAPYKTEYYESNANTFFEFDVTADMFVLGGDNTWTIEIFNTLISKGQLPTYTIDFAANAPGDVTFSPLNSQYKVDTAVNCRMTAAGPITKFKVCIIYGTYDVLFPSDPFSQQWLLPWTDIPASGNTATVTFTPKYQSYVTVFAKACDADGRTSLRTWTNAIWAYDTTPAVEDQIKEYVGIHVYGGGHTNPWFPHDPGQQDPFDWKLIVAIVILIIFILVGIFAPLPLYGKVVVVIVGVVIAVLYYLYAPPIFIRNLFDWWPPDWWPFK
jgi:hypothetical protein